MRERHGPPGGRGDGPGGGPRGRRMRRGRVPDLLLASLLDGPAHGYELIGRLETLSGGVWRPSPGSVYPLLQMFEDRGLVKAGESEGRKVFELTDAGRELAQERRVAETAAELPADEHHMQMRQELQQLRGAARELSSTGSPQQVDQAMGIIKDARQALYRLLAE